MWGSREHILAAVLCLYTLIVYSISWVAHKRTKKVADYLLGSRRMNGFVTAMSAGASDMSSWLLMALPGAVYKEGIVQLWMVGSLVLGALCNWVIVGKRLRIYTEKTNNALTLPAFLRHRFGQKGAYLQPICGVVLMIFFTFYAVAGFVSAARLARDAFGLSYTYALLASSIFIIAYTAIGGFLAVSWVDVFQGILMFMALLLVPYIAYGQLTSHQIKEVGEQLKGSFFMDVTHGISLLGILSLFAWGLGYMGQVHIIGRFMAIRSAREISLARNICTVWMSIAMLGGISVGLVGLYYYGIGTLSSQAGTDQSEEVFILLSKDCFNRWMYGILLCALLSSIMSTVSCLILISSSTLIEDVYLRGKEQAEEKTSLWVHRLAVVGLASISVCLASYNEHSSILSCVAFPWCGLGASFGPTVLFALYQKRLTHQGALAGMVTGALFVLGWEGISRYTEQALEKMYGLKDGFVLLPAFLLSSVAIFIVSKKTAPPSHGVIQVFEAMEKEVQKVS